MALTKDEIKNRLINNDALFNYIHVIQQNFDIIPDDKPHIGASIAYQDLQELKDNFINSLFDTITDWVYSSDKFSELLKNEMRKGSSLATASSAVQRKAREKFRKKENSKELLIQGQLGELMLFHFIQRYMQAIPLLRKMRITTSSAVERFGADAIHYKKEDDNNIFILGEAKTYVSDNSFKNAFSKSITSILNSYNNFHKELGLYTHEDFLDKELDVIAEQFLNNTIENPKIELVSIIIYNETEKINITDQDDIHHQIEEVIKNRFHDYDNNLIDIESNPILKRITYIAFPIWQLKELSERFQKMI